MTISNSTVSVKKLARLDDLADTFDKRDWVS